RPGGSRTTRRHDPRCTRRARGASRSAGADRCRTGGRRAGSSRGAVGAVELGLPDLEHLRRRREAGHVRKEAEQEVRRVVELPAHRQLDEVPERAVRDRNAGPVGLVVPEQARVVGEAELLEQVGRVRPERERRRSVPARRRAERFLEPRDPALHQLALLLDRQVQHALVVVAVVADLVPAALGDLGTCVGMLVRDLRRDHERRREVVVVEQRVDPGKRRSHVVVAARERARRRQLERAAPERLRVEVDGERGGAAVPPLPHGGEDNRGVFRLSARELIGGYRSREFTPLEVIDALAARIEELNPRLGAFTTLCLERAREEAKAVRPDDERPLAGVPLGVKDLFDSEGVRTTYGSPMFADHVPAADAVALAHARAAGAILVGKTQTHEFAWGITSVNRLMGTSRNPWAPDRMSGGSSGGSAVALAAGLVPLALGSDTGGS